MGKESQERRRFKINLRRKRREKIKRLKEKYKAAKTEGEKIKIIQKALKINPNLEGKDLINSFSK